MSTLNARIPDGRVLSAGAMEFVTKPFDADEVLLRCRNLLQTRFLHAELRAQNERLEESVRARTRELEDAQEAILERLALATEYRDDDTREHTSRVGALAASVAAELGLAPELVEMIRLAAPRSNGYRSFRPRRNTY